MACVVSAVPAALELSAAGSGNLGTGGRACAPVLKCCSAVVGMSCQSSAPCPVVRCTCSPTRCKAPLSRIPPALPLRALSSGRRALEHGGHTIESACYAAVYFHTLVLAVVSRRLLSRCIRVVELLAHWILVLCRMELFWSCTEVRLMTPPTSRI